MKKFLKKPMKWVRAFDMKRIFILLLSLLTVILSACSVSDNNLTEESLTTDIVLTEEHTTEIQSEEMTESTENEMSETSQTEIQSSETNETQGDEETMTDIKVTVNGNVFDAKIYNDSPCAQQLLSKFPLTVTMNELNGNEKYYRFSESFSSNPENVESINSGDIMLYQSDSLVLFYEAHNTSYTYTRIGYITDTTGLKEAVGTGNPTVTFEIE